MIGSFEIYIRGIPYECVVTEYSPDLPAIIKNDPDDSFPPEDGDFEFYLLDEYGNEVDVEDLKLTAKEVMELKNEWERIEQILFEENMMYAYHEYG